MSGSPDESIAATLDLIGDRWTFLIMRDAFRGIRRFGEFQDGLGIARNLLSDRLKKLVQAGLLSKQIYCERPPRYEYRLTPKGTDLSPSLVALKMWGDKHCANGAPELLFVHESCRRPISQAFVCEACNHTIGISDIRSDAQPSSAHSHGKATRA